MFAPVGKKKRLLQHRYAPLERSADGTPILSTPVSTVSNVPLKDESNERETSPPRATSPSRTVSITALTAAVGRLEKALSDVSMLGTAMNRLLEATSRYDGQSDVLKAKPFECRNLSYSDFRSALSSSFAVDFNSEEEYASLTEYFDPYSTGSIDGFSFLIAFRRLQGIRKERIAAEQREAREVAAKQAKDTAERAYCEEQKRLELGVEYGPVSAALAKRVWDKFESAAQKFDGAHPSSPSLIAFEVKSIKALSFRDMIRKSLDLRLDARELGALIDKLFPSHNGSPDIPALDFIRVFLRHGIEVRQRWKEDIKCRQEKQEAKQKAREEKQAENLRRKLQSIVDFNISPQDEDSAMKKLRHVAKHLTSSSGSSEKLSAFSCEELTPLEFKDLARRILNLTLSTTELGYIVQKYDSRGTGNVSCKPFLVELNRLGVEERTAAQLAQMEKTRKDKSASKEAAIAKQKAEEKRALSHWLTGDFTEENLQSVFGRLGKIGAYFNRSSLGVSSPFEAESLDPLTFRQSLRQIFQLDLTPSELSALLDHLPKDSDGKVLCHDFMTLLANLGAKERDQQRLETLERQRKAERIATLAEERRRQALESKLAAEISFDDLSESLIASTIERLRVAAMKYDPTHPGALSMRCFEVKYMDALQFKESLRRVFRLRLSPTELGALFHFFRERHIRSQLSSLAVSGDSYKTESDDVGEANVSEEAIAALKLPPHTQILSAEFAKYFLQLGVNERAREHAEQLEKQRREAEQVKLQTARQLEEHVNRSTYRVDHNFTDADVESFQQKLDAAAEKFDRSHPSAPSLSVFDAAQLSLGSVREALKSLFGLKTTPAEMGYLASIYDPERTGYMSTKDFLNRFLALGQSIREEKRLKSLSRSRRLAEERRGEEAMKLAMIVQKTDYKVRFNFTESEATAFFTRVAEAATRYDKSHPAAAPVESFQTGPVTCGVFRELVKRTFHLMLSPREVGMVLCYFLHVPTAATPLQGSTLATSSAVQPMSRDENITKSNRTTNHESTSKLESTDAPIVESNLQAQSAAVILSRVDSNKLAERQQTLDPCNELIDAPMFLIWFLRCGIEGRSHKFNAQLAEKRRRDREKQQRQEEKLNAALSRFHLEFDINSFTETDRESALQKLTSAAATYDRSSTGAVDLSAFNSSSLAPGVFRDLVRRCFGLRLTLAELAALTTDFNNGKDEIDCRGFLVVFQRLGSEERDKAKAIELAKQRDSELAARQLEERRIRDAESRLSLRVSYDYTSVERSEAFAKLSVAAKRYDKAHPSAMSLDGFMEKSLAPHVFREMLRRTFNLRVTPNELGALVHYFALDSTGNSDSVKAASDTLVDSKKFLSHFLKLGISEREKDLQESRRRMREETSLLERNHQDAMVRQAASGELYLQDIRYDQETRDEAFRLLRDAARSYDSSTNPPPSMIVAFQAKYMTPGVFRDQVRSHFGLRLTPPQIAVFADEFPIRTTDGSLAIACADFLVRFNQVGVEARHEEHMRQLKRQKDHAERQAASSRQARNEILLRQAIPIEEIGFQDEDFQRALTQIRQVAAQYDRSHPSAPSLRPFQGPDMMPHEFRLAFQRAFHVSFSPEELAALVAFFPANVQRDSNEDEPSIRGNDGEVDFSKAARVSCRQFLSYFHKIHREETNKRDKQRLLNENKVKNREKKRSQELLASVSAAASAKLSFVERDQTTFAEKFLNIVRIYTIDSAAYSLAIFRGPPLSADKLREVLKLIFHIRFSFAEIGVLFSLIPPMSTGDTGIPIFNGAKFLSWFYQLSRRAQSVLLGESTDIIDWNVMEKMATSISQRTEGPPKITRSSVPSSNFSSGIDSAIRVKHTDNADILVLDNPTTIPSPRDYSDNRRSIKSSVPSKENPPFRAFEDEDSLNDGFHQNDHVAFLKSTVDQSWFLPALTSISSPKKDGESLVEMREHLKDLFRTDSLLDEKAFSSSQLANNQEFKSDLQSSHNNYSTTEIADDATAVILPSKKKKNSFSTRRFPITRTTLSASSPEKATSRRRTLEKTLRESTSIDHHNRQKSPLVLPHRVEVDIGYSPSPATQPDAFSSTIDPLDSSTVLPELQSTTNEPQTTPSTNKESTAAVPVSEEEFLKKFFDTYTERTQAFRSIPLTGIKKRDPVAQMFAVAHSIRDNPRTEIEAKRNISKPLPSLPSHRQVRSEPVLAMVTPLIESIGKSSITNAQSSSNGALRQLKKQNKSTALSNDNSSKDNGAFYCPFTLPVNNLNEPSPPLETIETSTVEMDLRSLFY